MTQLLRQAGVDAILVPMHVGATPLAEVFAAFRHIQNLDGLVVTVPHKVPIAALVDTMTGWARLVGAVNLVRRELDGRWLGDISDGAGFAAGLSQSGFEPAGQRAFLVGAGGVGSAIAVELARAGASVRVYDVMAPRAAHLAARLATAGLDVSKQLRRPTRRDRLWSSTPRRLACSRTTRCRSTRRCCPQPCS